MNPFSIANAPPWLSEDPAKQLGQLSRLLERLLDEAFSAPRLYRVLPWLRNMRLWKLLAEHRAQVLYSGFLDTPPSDPTSTLQASTLTTFFKEVSEPVAEMIEALYLSPLLRGRRIIHEILYRMARDAGARALSPDVVIGVCANLFYKRLFMLSDGIEPQKVTWKITWRPTQVQLRWPPPIGIKESFLVLVTGVIPGVGGICACEEEGLPEVVLAFRCTPDSPSSDDTAVRLALYDALVFSFGMSPHYILNLSPPVHLCVQPPVPRAIRKVARMWHIEIEAHTLAQSEQWQSERERNWQWERELADRVLDPVHYVRIVDRVFERAYGYAPFLTKQQAAHQGGRCMFPYRDPLRHYPGLGELLSCSRAIVGEDGTVEYQGWHYRDYDEDLLRYFPGEQVTVRPSPLAEAVVLVYWHDAILCYAVADELRHKDGSFRPYWFPYPRLGE
jgi:hypothetical protein